MRKLTGLRFPHSQKPDQGFTLIELLVVVSIIALLMGAILTAYTTIGSKGRDVKRRSDLQMVKAALTQYYADQGFYPTAGLYVSGGLKLEDEGSTITLTNQVGNPGYVGPLKTYVQIIPRDPNDRRNSLDQTLNMDHYCYVAYKDQATYANDFTDTNSCNNTSTKCEFFVMYSPLEDPSATPVETDSVCLGHTNYRLKVTPTS